MTTDDIFLAALTTVLVILAAVGAYRVITRRRAPDPHFGAGGSTTVPLGTRGLAKSEIAASGVVLAAGEEWSARSSDGATIADGSWVTVVDQQGLILIVTPVRADAGVLAGTGGPHQSHQSQES